MPSRFIRNLSSRIVQQHNEQGWVRNVHPFNSCDIYAKNFEHRFMLHLVIEEDPEDTFLRHVVYLRLRLFADIYVCHITCNI